MAGNLPGMFGNFGVPSVDDEEDAINAREAAYLQLDPGTRAGLDAYSAGRGLGRAVGALTGTDVRSPAEKQRDAIEQIKQAMKTSGLQPGEPNYYQALAGHFSAAGLLDAANAAAQAGETAKLKRAQIGAAERQYQPKPASAKDRLTDKYWEITESLASDPDNPTLLQAKANLERVLGIKDQQAPKAAGTYTERLGNRSITRDRATGAIIDTQEVGATPPKAGADAPKPLPTSALKLQNELLEHLGLANNMDADLGAIEAQLQNGELSLGATGNLIARGRNAVGMSDQNSRNFASFKATLEKLRNDSLRLNKGVQTEGDAVRAWNEIFENLNDQRLVQQRLGELRRINQRAAALKENQVEELRGNYGLDGLDTSRFKAPPAVGKPAKASKRAGGGGDDPVRVRLPDGRIGRIPRSSLEAAKAQGAKEI